jgi:hypothetical protein
VRRAAKRDANEPEIVSALRAVGATVTMLSAEGVPDLLVGYLSETYLLEVKAPRGPKGGTGGALTYEQVDWWGSWEGRPPVIVRTVDEALAAIGAMTERNKT